MRSQPTPAQRSSSDFFCPFSAAGMDAFEGLRVIGVARAGIENVDLAAATERGILVVNVLGRNAEAVSDFAIGLMLAEGRNIARSHSAIRNGNGARPSPTPTRCPS